MQMRQQGMQDEQIIEELQQQGISSVEIQNSLNQANIKSAINNQNEFAEESGMQPSINYQNPEPQYTPQQPEEQYSENYYQNPSQRNYPVTEQNYPQNYGTETPQMYDNQTLVEIAEQTFLEKIKPVQDKINQFNEFKVLTETKLENIEDRLKRIEKIIDNLQISILEKVGSYGGDISGIKKEMGMMQESFQKMINPLAQHSILEKEKISSKPKEHKNITHSKNK